MSLRQHLLDLIDLFVSDIRSAFLSAIQGVVNKAIIGAMIDAIEAGDVEGAFRALGFSPAAMRPLTAAIERAYERGGITVGESFPKVLNTSNGRAVFRFDVRNSRAEAFLRDHSAGLVQRLTDEARTQVRVALTSGMQAGNNPRTVALDLVGRVDGKGARFGGIIGLTENQESWVQSARNKLLDLDDRYFTMELRDKRFDSIVARAIADGKNLPVDVINKLVARYRDNALKWRGDNIARTEALQSLNASEYEAIKQAVELGAVAATAVVREWDSAGDSRVRWTHRRMDGQKVGLDEPFVSPSGAQMMHPGDTSLGAGADEVAMCRCRVKTVVDWLSDLD